MATWTTVTSGSRPRQVAAASAPSENGPTPPDIDTRTQVRDVTCNVSRSPGSTASMTTEFQSPEPGDRVRRYRTRMRAAGLRPIQIWVRSDTFPASAIRPLPALPCNRSPPLAGGETVVARGVPWPRRPGQLRRGILSVQLTRLRSESPRVCQRLVSHSQAAMTPAPKYRACRLTQVVDRADKTGSHPPPQQTRQGLRDAPEHALDDLQDGHVRGEILATTTRAFDNSPRSSRE